MGWLKDLMKAASPPVRGYGQLARGSLAQPEWPEDTQPKARSLAALFSKLDRNIEMEWLADRPGVQLALSRTLGCSVDALRTQLEANSPDDEQGVRQIRFDDLPYARPFDLVEESLPAGLPAGLSKPSLWRRMWWVAPSGSGRTVVGQWLAARGRADFVLARSWTEAAPKIRGGSPVFVELERTADDLNFDDIPEDVALCVAAPFEPPAGSWTLLAPPSLTEELPDLLDWIEARLPEDGSFDSASVLHWLEPHVLSGVLPTFGAILGAAGLVDSVGVHRIAGRSLEQLAADQVTKKLKEASSGGSAEAQWLQDHGFDLVVRLAQQVLTDTEEPWTLARDEDEWIALIPEEFRQSIDAQWVTWSLAKAGGHTTVENVQKALRDVPPGAYRVVKGLIEARILRTHKPGKGLVVAPELLRHVALAAAEHLLITEGSPFGWGEALLRPHAEHRLIQHLYARFAAEDLRPLDNLLDLDVHSQPSLAIAVEASFVAVGRCLLSGQDISNETLVQLWDEQMALVLELSGCLPQPRLLGSPDSEKQDSLLRVSAWHLSALAISELLERSEGTAHPVLRPWEQKGLSVATQQLLDSVRTLLVSKDVQGEPWVAEGYALVFRLHLAAKPTRAHALALPALAARGVTRGRVNWHAMSELGRFPAEIDALEHAGNSNNLTWPRLARSLWQLWAAEQCPKDADALLRPDAPHSEKLWRHLPETLIPRAWLAWEPRQVPWPTASFSKPMWRAFAEEWRRRNPETAKPQGWLAAFTAMDAESVVAVAECTAHTAPTGPQWLLQLAWARAPEWALMQLQDRLPSQSGPLLSQLLNAAPLSQTAEATAHLQRGLSGRTTREEANHTSLHWLRERVARRVPGWRLAYGLLVEVQQRVERASQARGAQSAAPSGPSTPPSPKPPVDSNVEASKAGPSPLVAHSTLGA